MNPTRSELPFEDRYELLHQLSYIGKEGCTDIRCSRSSQSTSCRGYHCHLCDGATSMNGHFTTLRYIGGKPWRLVGGGAFSCQPGFEDIPLEPYEESASS